MIIMTAAPFKRKNYLIKKNFQLKYTFSVALILLTVMGASVAGIYFGMWGSIIENFSKFKVSENLENVRRIADYEQARYAKGDYRLEKIFREAELLSQREKEALKDALGSVNRSLIPKITILVLLMFFGGIFISHKIAGPMYRIERSAQAIREGDLRVNFNTRAGDEMKEATSNLGEMVKSLRDDVEKIKSANIALDSKVELLSGCLPAKDSQSMKDAIGQIKSVLSKYKT